MKISIFSRAVFLPICLAAAALSCLCQQAQTVKLPAPHMEGGRPIMEVLRNRHSTREFSSEKLSPQILSDLLWAAFGVNRPDSGRRTAPSAMNRQEIDIFVALPEGLYLYEARTHQLKKILAEDIRADTGTQAYVGEAALNLIYVADFSKMGGGSRDNQLIYSSADTGFIGQNVYLYCASEGLATVVRGSIDREALAKKMKLRPDQRIVLAQSVGHRK